MARCPYSVSATTMPPRKAPSARERPAREVSQAVPMQSVRMASRKTSRLRLASTKRSTVGTTPRAITMTATTTPAALARARPTSASASAPPPAAGPSRGTMSTIGTTHRSWKMSVPTMKRPCGASSSCRSASVRSTMAVLESAKTKP